MERCSGWSENFCCSGSISGFWVASGNMLKGKQTRIWGAFRESDGTPTESEWWQLLGMGIFVSNTSLRRGIWFEASLSSILGVFRTIPASSPRVKERCTLFFIYRSYKMNEFIWMKGTSDVSQYRTNPRTQLDAYEKKNLTQVRFKSTEKTHLCYHHSPPHSIHHWLAVKRTAYKLAYAPDFTLTSQINQFRLLPNETNLSARQRISK